MSNRNTTVRRLLGGVALTSLVVFVILGGVFAWRTSDEARGAALVGKNAFQVRYSPDCTATPPADIDVSVIEADAPAPIPCLTLIGHNGQTTLVGKGIGRNLGDFRLVVVGGSVDIVRVLPGGACSTGDFSGRIRLLSPGEVIPPGGEGGAFYAYLSVAGSAPADCQGKVVLYRVVIEAENPQLSPAAERSSGVADAVEPGAG